MRLERERPACKRRDSDVNRRWFDFAIDFSCFALMQAGTLAPQSIAATSPLDLMKVLSEKRALEKLHDLKSDFATRIRADYEHRAKSCLTCETQGACCQDVHFVNVQITRLEAVAIAGVIRDLPRRSEVLARTIRAVQDFGLSSKIDGFYACPLFEKGVGCLVHERGKPLPCITHACYENKEDLPPDELLHEQEARVEKLNRAAYQKPGGWLPLPLAIMSLRPTKTPNSSPDASPE